jgi:hypothetical protein
MLNTSFTSTLMRHTKLFKLYNLTSILTFVTSLSYHIKLSLSTSLGIFNFVTHIINSLSSNFISYSTQINPSPTTLSPTSILKPFTTLLKLAPTCTNSPQFPSSQNQPPIHFLGSVNTFTKPTHV